MRLLLAEDDRIIGPALEKALGKHGYGVDRVADGEAALAALSDLVYDIAVLDINLPELSGLDVLRQARRRRCTVPVLLLTARDTVSQKIEGLDAGADDYMVKPFDLDELTARIRALVRRAAGRTESVLSCGEVRLDPATGTVSSAGVPVALTAKEFKVLKLLTERAGRYVTKSDIEYLLYSAEHAAESNTVEVTVYALRKKLGSEFIKSMRGVGYRVDP